MNEITVIRNTVVYNPTIEALSGWEAAVSLGVTFVERRDEWSWALGELASFIRTSGVAGGRPQGGERTGTLSAFADAIGMRRESISAMCQNWEFFWDMRETLPENVTWHQLSEARRRSGWRPGMDITPEHQEKAAKFAEEYADAVPPRRKRSLADKLRAISTAIEDVLDTGDLTKSVAIAMRGAKNGIDMALKWIEEKEAT